MIEEKYASELPELGLGNKIKDLSPVVLKSWLSRTVADLVVSDPRYVKSQKLHSDGKIELFYKSIVLMFCLWFVFTLIFVGVLVNGHSLFELAVQEVRAFVPIDKTGRRLAINLFLKLVSIGGTALLAFMGAYLSLYPRPRGAIGNKRWVGVFALVGFATAAAGIALSNRTDEALEEMLTGGDHYCYYRAEFVKPSDLSGKAPLWMICDGPVYNLNVWFSPADSVNANDPKYWSIGGQYFRETIPGGFRSGMELGKGKYRIEMSARNGTVIENSEIKQSNDVLAQSLEVFAPPDGRKLHSE